MKTRISRDKQILASNQNTSEREYWLDKLSGPLVKCNFPYDIEMGKTAGDEPSYKTIKCMLNGSLFSELMKKTGHSDHKIHVLLIGVMTVLLNKYTGNRDILLCSPIYKPNIEGDFINTLLPLRSRIEENMTFKELLKQVGQTILEATENQNYPMEILFEQLNLPFARPGALPDIALVLENIHHKEHIHPITPGMIFSFIRTGDSLQGLVEYRADLYEPRTVQSVAEDFRKLLHQAIFHLDIELSSLDIPGIEEKRRPLPEHDGTGKEYQNENKTPAKEFVPPGNAKEKKLAQIWAEILEIEETAVSIDDYFFQLNANSLKAIMLTSMIHKEFNISIPLEEIFELGTIRELAGYIKGAEENRYASIEPIEKKEYYPLSSAQKRLYFIQQMDLNSTSYNMPLIFSLGKEVDKEKIASTLKRFIARHESLRTSFIKINEVPVQQVYKEVEFELEYFDLYRTQVEDKVKAEEERPPVLEGTGGLAPLFIKDFIRPFDLSRAPLMRSGLLCHPEGNHTWMVDIHHIVSDGTSNIILKEDFISLYNGKALNPLRLHYKDFSQWQNRLFAKGMIKTQEAYWLNLYRDAKELPRLNLPGDNKRPAVFTFAGDYYKFGLEREDAGKFKALGTRNSGTLYMNILAAMNTLFYKYTGQTDIIIGSGIAGRRHADLLDTIGMFVNTLVMRNHPHGDKDYELFLKEVIDHSVKAFENQDLQFEELVDILVLERDPSRNPLFDIFMVVQNFRQAEEDVLTAPGQKDTMMTTRGLQAQVCNNKTSKFDMTFLIYEKGEEVLITIEYYTAIFKRETIASMVRHFKKIIKEVISNPGIKLKDIEILTVQAKQILLCDFNDTKTGYPKQKTVVELFEEQVGQTPYHTAIISSSKEKNIHLTYRELQRQSNQVANYLCRENGVVPDERVGILMERAPAMIAAVLAILEAGGAYVPISPTYPEERIKNIIEDSSIRVLIGEKHYIKTLNRLQWECGNLETFLCIDSEDVYSEDEAHESELMSRKLWDYVGEASVDEVTGGGWNSSYTGNPIPKAEMDEYGDNILKKLEPLLHKEMRVMEIGAASGISMYRIAPRIGLYYGTDLSQVIIEKNRQRVREEGHKNIKLACLPAHEIHRLEEKNFDLVIINSVIQCFNGHNYLRKVIRKVIDLIGREGYLFIGDIMDQDLKEDLIADLTAFKQANKGKDYKTKIDWSEELFISRAFLQDLAVDYPEVHDVEFSGKIYTLENELTKFRYDALVYIDKKGIEAKKKKPKHKHQHDLGILGKYKTGELKINRQPGNLAYIIYTSGSTGTPKGVMVEHKSVVRLVKNTNFIEFKEGDKILQTGALEFDASTFEIWGSLLNGLTLVLESKNDLLVPGILKDIINKNKITTMWMTSPFFNQMLEADIEIFSGLKNFLVGGDALSPAHINRLRKRFPGLNVINGYGPTENVTFSTTYLLDKDYRESIPIGQPIANSTAYVMDGNGNLSPVGVAGELYVGGDGVARGYLNDAELTAEKFRRVVIHHSSFVIGNLKRTVSNNSKKLSESTNDQWPMTNDRLYCTGDCVKWQPSGNIEFLGRIDSQVKIRGFRIELGEIENHLLKHRPVKEAVVIDRLDTTGGKYLSAYITADEKVETAEIKEILSNKLPEYMIPSFIAQLEKLPLTSNGKIDRKALPEPEIQLDEDYQAPSDEIEEKLVKIWSVILDMPEGIIGINVNFFEIGGHSLKATILTSKIHKELNVKVPLVQVFKLSTIREIAQYIRQAAEEKFQSIEVVEKRDYYSLSSAQRRLYVLQKMDKTAINYNVPIVVTLEGELDRKQLQQTFQKLVLRHESLRTSFHMAADEPVQRVHAEVEFKVEYYDMKEVEVEEEVKIEEERPPVLEGTGGLAPMFIRNFIRPFDFSRAPLMRVGLIKTGENRHLLMVDIHHIITDGTSMGVLIKEFMKLYANQELRPLKLQYKDYAAWQNSEKQKNAVKNQEEYWIKSFEDDIPVLQLPTDYKRPPVQDFKGSTIFFRVGKEETEALKKLAAQMNATLYQVLLAITNILFSKLSGQEDIVIGTPIAGRRHADLKPIIGMFVNTLALRNYPVREKTFRDFLKEVKERTLSAFENQDYQFEELVENVSVNRDTGRNPLFDVMFALQNMEMPEVSIPGINLKPRYYENLITQFDMTLTGAELEEGLYFSIRYSTTLFKLETIERFRDYFKRIITVSLDDPNKKLSRIEIISKAEKRQLLFQFNQTLSRCPTEKTIQELFEEQVEKRTENLAAVYEGEHLTYKGLNEKTNQLALYLNEKGVQPDTIVGIMAERSIEMIIEILGILKAGGAYLPIDPDHPEERIQFMLADSGTKMLVTTSTLAEEVKKLRSWEVNTIFVDNFEISSPSRNQPAGCRLQPAAKLAYTIYTSGSTGRAKGVMIDHPSVVNFIKGITGIIDFNESDTILSLTTISFDIFGLETLLPLTTGSKVVVGTREEQLEPLAAARAMGRGRITILQVTPSRLQTLVSDQEAAGMLKFLKYLLVGGEALPGTLLKKAQKITKGKIINLYGPTETTIWSTAKDVSHGKTLNIGKPIVNTQIYIVAPSASGGALQPINVPGELCIGGQGLSRGYINNPGLTAEKFVISHLVLVKSHSFVSQTTDPVVRQCPITNNRIYHTGDLARWLPDGNIEFLGRIDHQVKVRGYRIELGEVESHLREHEEIQDAVVISRGEESEKYLCAYIVSKDKYALFLPGLREFLTKHLPDYMIPSYFIHVEKIPLTLNGKVNKKLLPEPEIQVEDEYAAPGDDLEKKLVEIWEKLLNIGRDKISINANFFKLGGHSLKAIILAATIHKEFNVRVPLLEIFKSPTVSRISSYIREAPEARYLSIQPVEEKEYYPLSSAQKRLYIENRMDPNSINYNIPTIMELEGDLDRLKLEKAFQQLVKRHESLRTSFELLDGDPVQRIRSDAGFNIQYEEVEVKSEFGVEHTARNFIRPFDLSAVPLLRGGLIKIGEKKYILMMDMHHIMADGISRTILVKDLMALYNGNRLKPLKIRYKDFSRWQNTFFASGDIKRQEEFWLKKLGGNCSLLPSKLPTDYPKSNSRSFAGNAFHFEIEPKLTAQVNRIVSGSGTTLYMVLLAVYNILLSKYTNQGDIIVGTGIAGRRDADLENIIGIFVNMMVMRNYPQKEKTFLEFLEKVKANVLEAYENQDYPFEELIKKLYARGIPAGDMIFDTVFQVQNMDEPGVKLPGLKFKERGFEIMVSHYDMTVIGMEAAGRIHMSIIYATRLFKCSTIRKFARRYLEILEQIVENPGIQLKDITVSYELLNLKPGVLDEDPGDFVFE